MNEDFVTFELAKNLKEKCFPQKTFGSYDMVGPTYFRDGRFYKDGCICHKDDAYTAPTIYQVLKWLREEKDYHICVSICDNPVFSWCYEITKIDGAIFCHAEDGLNTCEQAALAGIEYVLDNLI